MTRVVKVPLPQSPFAMMDRHTQTNDRAKNIQVKLPEMTLTIELDLDIIKVNPCTKFGVPQTVRP